MKARINAWLSKYKRRVSGTVALQEFKRRVLRELVYLLAKLNQKRSYLQTLNYITNVLPSQQHRKQRICLPLLHQVFPGASDQELTERARLYFRTLLMNGEKEFRRGLDSILPGVNCHWAKAPIREKRRYKSYDLGDTKCSKTKGQCEVGKALESKQTTLEILLQFLSALSPTRMTTELQASRDFLDRVVNGDALQKIHTEEPCLTVGDLLIAIESAEIPNFYTMNYRESQAFCDFFEQNLAVRPNNPERDELSYDTSAKPWPEPTSV